MKGEKKSQFPSELIESITTPQAHVEIQYVNGVYHCHAISDELIDISFFIAKDSEGHTRTILKSTIFHITIEDPDRTWKHIWYRNRHGIFEKVGGR